MTYGELIIELLPYMNHSLFESVPKDGYCILIDNNQLNSIKQLNSRFSFFYNSGIEIFSCTNETKFIGTAKILKDVCTIIGDK